MISVLQLIMRTSGIVSRLRSSDLIEKWMQQKPFIAELKRGKCAIEKIGISAHLFISYLFIVAKIILR